MTSPDYTGLSKVRPHRPLVTRLRSNAGRNQQGRITVRHQGGGHKKLYRMVDFKQGRMNSKAIVETIEYDPYRTAFIALIKYDDGSKAYILAPEGMKTGAEILTAEATPLKTGNRMRLKNIPVGYQVHNIEMNPGDLMIFNTLLAHGVRPNHSDNRVRMAQYISMFPANEDDEKERAERIHMWKNLEHPRRDAFPGDPREWEKKHATTAKLNPLGEKLLGLKSWHQ